MRRDTPLLRKPLLLVFVIALVPFSPGKASADGKFGFYGHRMEPHGSDAEDYSRASWGGGLILVVPIPGAAEIFAFDCGLEMTHFLSETKTFRDPDTGLRTEQQTTQEYWRLFIGSEIGGHGRGFLRPHVG